MTSKSMSAKPEAFLLRPSLKSYLWGGRRLIEEYGKKSDTDTVAEAWECSTHPAGSSVIASGIYTGRLLADLLRVQPTLLGKKYAHLGELPILIKLIDAKKDLSVQVHPNDEYAKNHEQGERGKTEMWYVLEADSDANLVYGFNHDMSKENLRQSLENGTVSRYLQKIPAQTDEVYYIPAGLVHALGAGVVVAEIQESSDLTYRLYDYDRLDKDGKKRELHIDKAIDVAHLKKSDRPKQPVRVLRYQPGVARELLCCCQYFLVERLLVNVISTGKLLSFMASVDCFEVLLCINGSGVLINDSESLAIAKGDCIFLPAGAAVSVREGNLQLLRIRA